MSDDSIFERILQIRMQILDPRDIIRCDMNFLPRWGPNWPEFSVCSLGTVLGSISTQILDNPYNEIRFAISLKWKSKSDGVTMTLD